MEISIKHILLGVPQEKTLFLGRIAERVLDCLLRLAMLEVVF